MRRVLLLGVVLLLLGLVSHPSAAGPNATGSVEWQTTPHPIARDLVATANSTVVTGVYETYDGRAGVQTVALDSATGEHLWTHRFAIGQGSPVIQLAAKGETAQIYVHARSALGQGVVVDRVAALDAENGEELWQVRARGPARWVSEPLLSTNDGVVLVDRRQAVFADPDRRNCRLRGVDAAGVQWVRRLNVSECAADIDSRGRLLVTGIAMRVHSGTTIEKLAVARVDASDGATRWQRRHPLPGRVSFAAIRDLDLARGGDTAALTMERTQASNASTLMVNASNGNIRWARWRTESQAGAVSVSPGGRSVILYGSAATTTGVWVENLRVKDGVTRWSLRVKGLWNGNEDLSIAGGRIYLSARRVWKVPTPCDPGIPDCGTDLEQQAQVVALALTDGSEVWRAGVGARGYRVPDVVHAIAGIDVHPANENRVFIGGRQNGGGYVAGVLTP